jgi:uncharacterized membrane protein
MISDFIYKYYIDPIRYGEAYNVVDTLTYAIILVLCVYLLYRWMSQSTWLADIGFRIDTSFILATIPYVVLGGVLRVVQDTGMIRGDFQFLLVTPLIYFVLFFFTIGMLFLSRYLTVIGLTKNINTFFWLAGTVSSVVVFLSLIAWGINNTTVDFRIFFIIIGMALVASAAVWAAMRYLCKWQYAGEPLYVILIFGHMLDASATSYGIDLHPALQYVEQHVLGSTLIGLTGTAFVMFPLKLLVLFPGVWIMEAYKKEANVAFWHLVLLAMIVVGLAPGIRDMMRMVLYV